MAFYKTDYFKNVELDNINTKLSDIFLEYKSLYSTCGSIRNGISTSNDWLCNAKIKFDKRMYNIYWRIETIQNKINFILEAIKIAKIVVEYQEQMKSEENEVKQQQLANRINFQINKYKAKILEIRTCSGTKDAKYDGSLKVMDYKSDPLSVVISEVKNYKDKTDAFIKKLKEIDSNFFELQSILKQDEYLDWAWGIACKTADRLDYIGNVVSAWFTNYVDNLDSIENALPERNYIPTMEVKSAAASSHGYPVKPTFETYQKSHQTSEIIVKKPEPKTTDSKKTKDTKDYKQELDEDAPANTTPAPSTNEESGSGSGNYNPSYSGGSGDSGDSSGTNDNPKTTTTDDLKNKKASTGDSNYRAAQEKAKEANNNKQDNNTKESFERDPKHSGKTIGGSTASMPSDVHNFYEYQTKYKIASADLIRP